MKRPSAHAVRRAALAASLTSLAVAGVGAVSAAAASGSVGAQIPACATSQLTAWVGLPGDGAAGSTYFELQLSDTGTTACNLYGFPGVSGLSSTGKQLGSPASWDHGFKPKYVVLTPGTTAHFVLQIVDAVNFPTSTCTSTAAAGLRIYPPNQTVAEQVPLSFQACLKTGSIYLNVRPVTAGAGIPGYSQ
jgi:hypothetical protein